MLRRLVRALPLFLIAGSNAAQGQLWTVDDDGGPGIDFTDIQPAVDAAGEGDVVLVSEGAYSSFAVLAKSLTIAAREGDEVKVQHPVSQGTVFGEPFFLATPSTIEIADLGLGQRVVLQGIDLQPGLGHALPLGQPALTIRGNHGSVWVEDCIVRANVTWAPSTSGFIWSIQDATHGAVVSASDDVVITRSLLVGGYTGTSQPSLEAKGPLDDRHALWVRDSRVSVYDSILVGSQGLCSLPSIFTGGEACAGPSRGGDGIHVESGALFASGCELRGGESHTWGSLSSAYAAGHPGDGLEVSPAAGSVRLRDCQLFEGEVKPSFGCQGPPQGADLVDPARLVQFLPGRNYPFEASSPLAVGADGKLEWQANPGDVLFAGLSASTLSFDLPGGVLHLAQPGLLIFAGVTPSTGRLELPLVLGAFEPGTEAAAFPLQAVVFTTEGTLVLGAPASLVGLD